MTTNFIQQYSSLDDDEKMDLLAVVTEELNSEVFNFLFTQLGNYEDEDEFVMIEIIKVLALYSPDNLHKKVIKLLFSIVEKSDDELLQSYALQGLEHLSLSDKDYQKILDIKKTSDDKNLQATAEMTLMRKDNAYTKPNK